MRRQTLLIVLTALGATLSYHCMNEAFERSDRTKAIALVRRFGTGGRTLEDALASKHPSARTDSPWSADISSSCRGLIDVHCQVPPDDYAFMVDLVRAKVTPANDSGRAIFQRLMVAPRQPLQK